MTLRNTRAGQRVRLIHGETLDHRGNFTTMNVNKTGLPVDAFQEVTYFCRGAEEESYVPEFAVFGFRYVCVEGYEGEIRDGDFIARAIYSDMKDYSYGAVSEFLFAYTAGIRIDEVHPGYQEFELHAVPGGTLKSASAVFESPYGIIRSKWQLDGGTFHYQCDVPVNTKAHVTLPDGSRHTIGSGHYEYRVIV